MTEYLQEEIELFERKKIFFKRWLFFFIFHIGFLIIFTSIIILEKL